MRWNSPKCRLAAWRALITEGVLEDKPAETLNADDFDQIDARLLLEDMAEQDGAASVEQMFVDWDAERATTKRFSSVEEFMTDLDAYVASHAHETTSKS